MSGIVPTFYYPGAMGRIIQRTVTITICESWTIVWTDDDLPATPGNLKNTSLP